ncbi:MAG: hypothetical protein WC303_01055 [Candidatus Paceibacterota bacterium]|jgi:hypothetical protein
MKIYPTITTITGSEYKNKIKEATELDIKDIAFFPTCLNEEQRKEAYVLIEKSSIRNIPFVHLRSDMGLWELDYFIKKYNTQVFNIHSEKEYPVNPEWIKYRNIIGVENVYAFFDEEEIKKFGGICLDFSHLDNDRLTNKERYAWDLALLEKYPIRCNHISVMETNFHLDEGNENAIRYDSHFLKDLSQLDYLKKYPIDYFSDFCAMELENKIIDQLKAINYVNNLLKDRDGIVKGMGF